MKYYTFNKKLYSTSYRDGLTCTIQRILPATEFDDKCYIVTVYNNGRVSSDKFPSKYFYYTVSKLEIKQFNYHKYEIYDFEVSKFIKSGKEWRKYLKLLMYL